jgi:hypothetical protein
VGTDRNLHGQSRCPCGAGKIVITSCAPDQPWGGGATWFEGGIDCPICLQTHQIVPADDMNDKRVRLVLRKDVEERESHWREFLTKTRAIMKMPEVQTVLTAAKDIIAQQKSIAAKYSLLDQYDLARMSEASFRNKYLGFDVYFNDYLGVRAIPGLMKLTGISSPAVEAALADAERCYERHVAPIPAIKTGIPGLIA